MLERKGALTANGSENAPANSRRSSHLVALARNPQISKQAPVAAVRDTYELSQAKATLESTSAQLEEARAAMRSTSQQLAETRVALAASERQLSESGAALARAKSALQEENAATAIERAAAEAEQRRCEELEGEVGQLHSRLRHEQERVALLTTQLRDTQARAEQLAEQCEAERANGSDLTEQLGGEQQARSAAEQEVMRLQQLVRQLEADNREGEMLRRKLHAQMQELRGNIRVVCRMRPLLSGEEAAAEAVFARDGTSLELGFAERRTTVHGDSVSGNAAFQFDKCFGPSSTQHQVFEELSHLVQSVLDGYSACVFSYGATGSGKTYTMEGGQTEEHRGMIPRSVDQIFHQIQSLVKLGWSYKLQATYVEIYNETLRDLLADSGAQIKISHGKDGTTTLVDAHTVPVHSPSDIHDALRTANKNRSVASTSANDRSSRSHSVFSLSVRGRNSATGAESTGVLHLVDLAGSERLAVSKAEGQRLKETQAINKSLAALSDVIASLANGEAHVPYRNSKLTYLLQNSLGGASSKTLMLVQISPLAQDVNETLCSLRFASKVNACEIGVAKRSQKVSL